MCLSSDVAWHKITVGLQLLHINMQISAQLLPLQNPALNERNISSYTIPSSSTLLLNSPIILLLSFTPFIYLRTTIRITCSHLFAGSYTLANGQLHPLILIFVPKMSIMYKSTVFLFKFSQLSPFQAYSLPLFFLRFFCILSLLRYLCPVAC